MSDEVVQNVEIPVPTATLPPEVPVGTIRLRIEVKARSGSPLRGCKAWIGTPTLQLVSWTDLGDGHDFELGASGDVRVIEILRSASGAVGDPAFHHRLILPKLDVNHQVVFWVG